MSSIVNRFIRIFPRSGVIDKNEIIQIGNTIISNTRYLENQLEYFVSPQYADIIFTDEDGEHFHGVDFDKFDIWELSGSSYGNPDWIREIHSTENIIGNDAIYQFDSVEIVRTNSPCEKLFTKGNYKGNKEYPIGEEESRSPVFVEKFDLLKYSKSTAGHGVIELNIEDECHSLNTFVGGIETTGSMVSKTDDIQEVSFMFNNRIVRKFKWIDDSIDHSNKHRYGYWEFKNADFWDNCISSEWVEFQKEKTDNRVDGFAIS